MSARMGAVRTLLLGLLAASACTPLLVLLVASMGERWHFPALTPTAWSAESWRSLLGGGRLAAAGGWSLALGIGTGLLAATAGLLAGRALARLTGWRRYVGAAAAFLPVAAPPIALATGLQFTFLAAGLGGTTAGVLLAHAVPAVGYTSLYFLGLFQLFDPGIEDEARSLGASRAQVWTRVLIPLLRRPIAEAFVLGFLVSWAQVPLTLLIGGGTVRTLPVEVLGFVRAGQDRYAAAGALLLVVPALATLVVGLSTRRAETAPL